MIRWMQLRDPCPKLNRTGGLKMLDYDKGWVFEEHDVGVIVTLRGSKDGTLVPWSNIAACGYETAEAEAARVAAEAEAARVAAHTSAEEPPRPPRAPRRPRRARSEDGESTNP